MTTRVGRELCAHSGVWGKPVSTHDGQGREDTEDVLISEPDGKRVRGKSQRGSGRRADGLKLEGRACQRARTAGVSQWAWVCVCRCACHSARGLFLGCSSTSHLLAVTSEDTALRSLTRFILQAPAQASSRK